MQLTLVQFLGALTANFTQGLSAEKGIVTLESGDTFDVKAGIQGLQSLLMCASHDLKDAHEQLVGFISNQPDDTPYYHETREQLLAVRQGLEAIDTTGAKPVALASPRLLAEVAVLASAFKDVINSAENGQAYSFEELSGPSFADARDVMSKYDPENPEQHRAVKTVYCIALKGDGAGGGVSCYGSEAARNAALGSFKATEEVPFEMVVPANASDDEITELADSAAFESNLSVSLDGGITYKPAPNGVRIIYDKVDVIGENEPGQVHINATSESIVTDVWVTREEHLDHNIGTTSDTPEGIASDLVEEGA